MIRGLRRRTIDWLSGGIRIRLLRRLITWLKSWLRGWFQSRLSGRLPRGKSVHDNKYVIITQQKYIIHTLTAEMLEMKKEAQIILKLVAKKVKSMEKQQLHCLILSL